MGLLQVNIQQWQNLNYVTVDWGYFQYEVFRETEHKSEMVTALAIGFGQCDYVCREIP